MITALLFAAPSAYACEWLHDAEDSDPCEDRIAQQDEGDPPETVLRNETKKPSKAPRDKNRRELQLRYGLQFLPDAPAHHLYARLNGKKDAYLGAEVRYMPLSDMLWATRAGAGFDIFGKGGFDLTLGLWVGAAGQWDVREEDGPTLLSTPIAGTEIGLGLDLGRVFGKYRWLGGIGGGPIDDLLTENELTIGFDVFRGLQIFGQYLRLNPGREDRRQHGLGVGVQATL